MPAVQTSEADCPLPERAPTAAAAQQQWQQQQQWQSQQHRRRYHHKHTTADSHHGHAISGLAIKLAFPLLSPGRRATVSCRGVGMPWSRGSFALPLSPVLGGLKDRALNHWPRCLAAQITATSKSSACGSQPCPSPPALGQSIVCNFDSVIWPAGYELYLPVGDCARILARCSPRHLHPHWRCHPAT